MYELRDGGDGAEKEESNDRQKVGRGFTTAAERMQNFTPRYIYILPFDGILPSVLTVT